MTTPSHIGSEAGDTDVLALQRGYDPAVIPHTQRLADAWVAHLAARRREGPTHLDMTSCAALRRGIRGWLRYLASEARNDQPTTATVEAFVTWVGRTHRAATVAFNLAAVRGLYAWAAAGGLAPDIAANVHPTGGASADPPLPPLNDADYRRLLRVIAGDDLRSRRDRALLACLHAVPVDTLSWSRALVGAVDFDRPFLGSTEYSMNAEAIDLRELAAL